MCILHRLEQRPFGDALYSAVDGQHDISARFRLRLAYDAFRTPRGVDLEHLAPAVALEHLLERPLGSGLANEVGGVVALEVGFAQLGICDLARVAQNVRRELACGYWRMARV